MHPRPKRGLATVALAACLLLATGWPTAARPATPERALAEAMRGLDAIPRRTGILYDRVLPLSGIERFDGGPLSPPVSPGLWRQILHELRAASDDPGAWPAAAVLAKRARRPATEIPIAVIAARYERLRAGALADGAVGVREGRLVPGAGDPFAAARVFAASALRGRTHRGGDLVFTLDPELVLAHAVEPPRRITVDFADGEGPRELPVGGRARVRYRDVGPRTIRLRWTEAGGGTLESSFPFEVAALAIPSPDDTLHVTATTPYLGVAGTGRGYVLRAPGHATLVDPVVLVEGFDLDNSTGWDEAYGLLARQGLADSLRARGHDLVVLDFTDATDHLQRNAYVVATLLDRVQAEIGPAASLAVVGASMGGLLARYALAHLETSGAGHQARSFIAFDSPHGGADIPLGIQYWVQFFAGLSADAAALVEALNRPASRQMLLYHFTDPPSANPAADPMRAQFLADLAAAGGFPAGPRSVAIANGSGAGDDQGFSPAAQIIRYEYSSLFVDVTGNVWALPDHANATIFQGRTRIVFSTTTRTVTVGGTWPYDGAPGGSRATMAEMDAVAAPYGDIVALHPSHCFIPTVSALALDAPDPFFDIAGAPDLLARTPFDAVYVPTRNQAHVDVTAENAAWFLAELARRPAAAGAGPAASVSLRPGAPNPFTGATRLAFTLSEPAVVELAVFGVDGRAVATLARGRHAAGTHGVSWDGRDASGREAPAGVYWCRLTAGGETRARRIVRVR